MSELLFMEPVFKEAIWGGSRLKEVYGYDIPSDHTGECWAISAHKSGDGRVASGTYKGQTLSSLWENHPELFGAETYTPRWHPLLKRPLLDRILKGRECRTLLYLRIALRRSSLRLRGRFNA